MPSHIGHIVRALFDADLPCFLITDAWHFPEETHPSEFAKFVSVGFERAALPGPKAKELACQLEQTIKWPEWRTPFSTTLAESMIHEFYETLRCC